MLKRPGDPDALQAATPQGANQQCVPDPGFKIKHDFADYIRPLVGAGFVVAWMIMYISK